MATPGGHRPLVPATFAGPCSYWGRLLCLVIQSSGLFLLPPGFQPSAGSAGDPPCSWSPVQVVLSLLPPQNVPATQVCLREVSPTASQLRVLPPSSTLESPRELLEHADALVISGMNLNLCHWGMGPGHPWYSLNAFLGGSNEQLELRFAWTLL